MGGGGSVEFPFTNHVSPRHSWSREVCEPLAHPPTHPPIPPTPNQPSIHPTHQPFPNPPLDPNNPCPIFLLLSHPPIHLSTHPPIQPSPTYPPTPTHPCSLTTPPTLNISISCQMSSHIIAQHPFRIQKLMRVIWQYPNYGIPNFG